jgi:RNA polymerase sigma-70 factor (ECF subfamily)
MSLTPALAATDPPSTDDLDALLHRCRNGDLAAFDAVTDRYYDLTFRLAHRMLADRDAAEDATQEIFIKAWRYLPRFRGAARFSTWLHTIAVNHCLDAARRKSREASRLKPLKEEDDLFGGDDPLLSQITGGRRNLSVSLEEALSRLSEKLRVVVTLRFYADRSPKEIADALDLPLSTVYSRLNLALAHLGRSLDHLRR